MPVPIGLSGYGSRPARRPRTSCEYTRSREAAKAQRFVRPQAERRVEPGHLIMAREGAKFRAPAAVL